MKTWSGDGVREMGRASRRAVGLVAGLVAASFLSVELLASLEFGHKRARTRGFENWDARAERDLSEADGLSEDVAAVEATTGLEDEAALSQNDVSGELSEDVVEAVEAAVEQQAEGGEALVSEVGMDAVVDGVVSQDGPPEFEETNLAADEGAALDALAPAVDPDVIEEDSTEVESLEDEWDEAEFLADDGASGWENELEEAVDGEVASIAVNDAAVDETDGPGRKTFNRSRSAASSLRSTIVSSPGDAEDEVSETDDSDAKRGLEISKRLAWVKKTPGAAAELGTEVASEIGKGVKTGVAFTSGVASGIGRSVRSGIGTGIALIQPEQGFSTKGHSGYLAQGAPVGLRFADMQDPNRRPPAPALPEFNQYSHEYVPYIVEELLPEEAEMDPSVLSEIVVELEPHTVLSGRIDVHSKDQEDVVEEFDLDEQKTTVLRPEEVLIFFETDGVRTDAKAIIPFDPAKPTQPSGRSKANYIKE